METRSLSLGFLCLGYSLDPALVQKYEKYDVVAEARQPMSRWHFDYEGKQVVDERIQSTVHEKFPRQMSHRL